MKIFAYGSNMHSNRLRQRVPSAVKIITAIANGYLLKCNKIGVDGSAKANIENSGYPTDNVWGVVYEIDDKQKTELDKAEFGYNDHTIVVTDIDNKDHHVIVYIARKNFIDNNLLPFEWYKQYLLTGAKQNNFPGNQIAVIESIESIPDKNRERRQKNLSILNGLE